MRQTQKCYGYQKTRSLVWAAGGGRLAGVECVIGLRITSCYDVRMLSVHNTEVGLYEQRAEYAYVVITSEKY
jgi:hypothetical protein